jgi:hypothetical protein
VGMAVKKVLLAPMQQWLPVAAYDVAQVSAACALISVIAYI